MSEAWTGPWVAKLTDGPYKGQTRHWAVGPIWREIRLARTPIHGTTFICGGDGIPEAGKTEPWPGETTYRIRSSRRTKLLGDDTMIAYYRKVTPDGGD